MDIWKCIKCGKENIGCACTACGVSRKLSEKRNAKPDFGNDKEKQMFVTND